MDLATRTAILTPERRLDLDCLIEARLEVKPANTKVTAKRQCTQIKDESFRARIQRLAARLCFSCVTDMLVWYELEFKRAQNAEKWRRRVARLDKYKPEDHRGLRYVVAALDAERNGIGARIKQVALDEECDEISISRAVKRFAAAANIYYSLDWLMFVYAIYDALREREPALVGG